MEYNFKTRLTVVFLCLYLVPNYTATPLCFICYSLYRTIVSSLVVRFSFVHPLKLGKDYI